MKRSIRATSLFVALLGWLALSGVMVFAFVSVKDRARLIRDNDNERILNVLLASLRDHEDFGSVIESSGRLKNSIIGLAIYGGDLAPVYSWGKVPPVFDESLLSSRGHTGGGRYTLEDKKNRSIKFIMDTREVIPPRPPENNRRQERSLEPQGPRGTEGGNPEFHYTPPETRSSDHFFFYVFRQGKYFYIEIYHPAFWRTINIVNIVFPFCEILLLFFILYFRGLYLRNIEYREKLDSQKNLVVLGTAASTLAHEIKNPLLSMRLQTEILKKMNPGRGEEEIGIINEEIDRLSELTYRVNDYLREAEGSPVPLNASRFIREVSVKICGRDVVDPSSPPDAVIVMDPQRARSVFENLFRNALESGGPPEDIAALVNRNNGGVVMDILDRGKGIPEADRRRAFDPFYTTKSTGTGIGLSISRRFVEAAGGKIDLISRKGGGTDARVILPERAGGKGEAEI